MVFAACAAVGAFAHDERSSMSSLVIERGVLTWSVDIGIPGWQRVVPLPDAGVDLTDAELQSQRRAIAAYLQAHLELVVNGEQLPLIAGELEAIEEPLLQVGEPYLARARQVMRARCTGTITTLRLGIRLFAEITNEHCAVVAVRCLDRARAWTLLGPGELIVPADLLTGAPPAPASALAAPFGRGLHDMLAGPAHLAFMLALLLGVRTTASLLRVVTWFMLACSIALWVASLGLARIPPAFIASLTAASIVYVAAENLGRRQREPAAAIAFVFGLVHGLDLARALPQLAAQRGTPLMPLIAFHAGIGAGQVAIVLGAGAVIHRLRRADPLQPARPWVMVAGSTPLLLLGLCWLIDGLFALELITP
ncbi:MAG: HupE/UreJ family protein [Planctomycetota bacterium]